ncbi:sterol desaturase family protein [Rhodococcus sp. NPDC058514]|uniref:sterol desaturase family protein n=1 Tax=unclassified Rhodococcus (in: high G+C Gram-positive bacteria) TaxID=192944 RepID=UPI0036474AC0
MSTSARSARRQSVTLRTSAAEFVRHPSPWMISAMLAAALVGRLLVGDWQVSDAWLPIVMLAAFPLLEWAIHVCILHWRPKRFAGLTLDSHLARSHREHHADPRDVPLIFIPWQTLVLLIPTLIVGALLAFPRPGLALTFLIVIGAIGLAYEWTHYLIHSDYRPKSRMYHAIWLNHRQHHYKNEHYWFTVTTAGTADRVLHTYPDVKQVPTSPTAKNLHAGAARGA